MTGTSRSGIPATRLELELKRLYRQIGGFNLLYIPKAAFEDTHPEELEATIVELKAKPVQVAAQ